MALDDQFFLVSETRKLTSELCILALYKQIETHIKQVVERNFPSIKKRGFIFYKEATGSPPFPIDFFQNFAAFDELRLINNAINHEGKVSAKLVKKFPVWQAGDELKELDKAYERLFPLVRTYIREFVAVAYRHSARFNT